MKQLLLALAALAAIAAILLGIYFAFLPAKEPGDKTIVVDVVFKNGKVKSFIYHTQEEFLGPVLVNKRLVEGVYGEDGFVIHMAHGEKTDPEGKESYWTICVGSEPVDMPVDSIPVHDGDHFRLVYTKGETEEKST